MRNLIFLLILLPISIGAQDNFKSLLEEADEAYHQEDFSRAADIYENIIEGKHKKLPSLYFNLGNTRYYQGKFAEALWAYDQAQALSPWNRDISENILAAEKELDFIPSHPDKSNLEKWIFWYRLLPPILWQIFLALSLTVFSISILYYLKGKDSIVLIGLMVILSFSSVLSLFSYQQVQKYPYGRIVSETYIYSGNGDFYDRIQAKPLLPGQQIRILEKRRDWYLLEWAEGQKGWVASSVVLTE